MKVKNTLLKIAKIAAVALVLVGLYKLFEAQGNTIVSNVIVRMNSLKADNFMDEKDVENLVYSRLDTIVNKPIGTIQLSEIETVIESDPSVKNAEVYAEINGNVHFDVELKKVIARIKPDTSVGFYVDVAGEVMPWVAKYTPRVLTVSGDLGAYVWYDQDTNHTDLTGHHKLLHDVFALASYVDTSAFWKAQIGQIHIRPNGDAVMLPLIGEHEIVLGDLKDFEVKFKKLMKFYSEVITKVGWGKYSEVNLKFEDQIVCK